jgi:hypothetical protein
MSNARDEFYSNVQIARKKIRLRYLIWFLCCFAAIGLASWLFQPLSEGFDGIVFAVFLTGGIGLLWPPIWRLQKMPCPYCHYSARVGTLPFRHFRCMHCHREIGESTEPNQIG